MGPKPRSYAQKTPKKMIRLALLQALSDRAQSGAITVVDAWSFPEIKTKEAVAAVKALGLSGRILVVVDPYEYNTLRSFANIPEVQLIDIAELNAYDILKSDVVVFTENLLPGAGEELQEGDAVVEVSFDASESEGGE